MSKAEKFIEERTMNHSNEIIGGGWNNGEFVQIFNPWLTPDQARRAVEIAREELIDKFYDWLKSNATYIHPRKGIEECITTLAKLKQAMEDE